jgi:RNA polymerase sigma-70 factor (ECF subfamily)
LITTGSGDETALIERTQQGDNDAYQILLHRHLPMIHNYASRMLGNQDDAADVAQEVFIRFWQKAATFDPTKAKLSTWLHQIAHNLCIDLFRKNARFVDSEPELEESEPMKNLDESEETSTAVQQAVTRLPERQRSALLFCHYQGLSNKQAADILEVSVDALESLLSRARRSLRETLAEHTHG